MSYYKDFGRALLGMEDLLAKSKRMGLAEFKRRCVVEFGVGGRAVFNQLRDEGKVILSEEAVEWVAVPRKGRVLDVHVGDDLDV